MFDWQTVLFMQKAICFGAISFLVVAAYTDIRTYRVPNILVASVAILGAFRLLLLHDLLSAIYALAMIGLIFAIGILLFSRGIIGGGDVKLMMATILLIRYRDFYEFFIVMFAFGASLSLAMLVIRHYAIFLGARLTATISTTRLPVPYGVAIAVAGIVTILMQPILFRYSFPLVPSFLW